MKKNKIELHHLPDLNCMPLVASFEHAVPPKPN